VRPVPARWIGVGGLALAFGIVLVLVRGEPTIGSDQGILLSVAGRILDGDDLYSEVIENKDPLVFYTFAGALWIGGWRGPFLLDGIWLAVAALGFALLLRELRLPRAAVVAGFFVYPLALTAAWFYAGLTMLGGLAFAPLVPALWLRRSYAAAGALLAVVMLFKINLVFVAAAPVAALFLLGVPDAQRWRQLARAAGGAGATFAAGAIVLVIWGGLREYLDSIVYNVDYANALVGSDSTLVRMREHMRITVELFRVAGRWQLPLALLVVAVFAAAVALTWTRRAAGQRVVATVAAFTLALTVLTLALTAYWDHHLQMLAYPAALIAATFVSVAAGRFGPRAAVAVAAVCVVFALWSSLKNEDRLELSPGWSSTPTSGGADALNKARARFYPRSETVPYMVFGGNSENGHAAFLDGEFELTCRWFQLAPISLDWQFEETLECARRERPLLVFVSLGFFDERQRLYPRWGAFVAGARQFLTAGYEKVVVEHPGFEAWKRRGVES
jgi:hypothetical protein